LIGESPNGIPNNLVPFVTQTAIGLRKELLIFGSDYNTPDGTAIRDYIDVCDLSKGHISAMNRLINNEIETNYEFFNVGTGFGISVLEIVKKFEKVTDVKLNYRFVERRSGDIEKIWADVSSSNKKLNWQANTDITVSLKNAWEWEIKGK